MNYMGNVQYLKDVADVYLQPEWKKLVNIFNKIKIKFNIAR